eukprot:774780-Prymnesium_polylepis.2
MFNGLACSWHKASLPSAESMSAYAPLWCSLSQSGCRLVGGAFPLLTAVSLPGDGGAGGGGGSRDTRGSSPDGEGCAACSHLPP